MPLYTIKPPQVEAYKILKVWPVDEGGAIPLQVFEDVSAPALHVQQDALLTMKAPEVGDYIIVGNEDTLGQIVPAAMFEKRFILVDQAAAVPLPQTTPVPPTPLPFSAPEDPVVEAAAENTNEEEIRKSE